MIEPQVTLNNTNSRKQMQESILESVSSVTIDEDRLKRMNEGRGRQRGRDGRRWARVCKEEGCEGGGEGERTATGEYRSSLLVY